MCFLCFESGYGMTETAEKSQATCDMSHTHCGGFTGGWDSTDDREDCFKCGGSKKEAQCHPCSAANRW